MIDDWGWPVLPHQYMYMYVSCTPSGGGKMEPCKYQAAGIEGTYHKVVLRKRRNTTPPSAARSRPKRRKLVCIAEATSNPPSIHGPAGSLCPRRDRFPAEDRGLVTAAFQAVGVGLPLTVGLLHAELCCSCSSFDHNFSAIDCFRRSANSHIAPSTLHRLVVAIVASLPMRR